MANTRKNGDRQIIRGTTSQNIRKTFINVQLSENADNNIRN